MEENDWLVGGDRIRARGGLGDVEGGSRDRECPGAAGRAGVRGDAEGHGARPRAARAAVTEIHAALLAAVYAQPVPAVTVLLPVPAAAVNVWLVGEIEYAQAPACVTLKVAPAIVSVPDRLVVAVLAATLKEVVPGLALARASNTRAGRDALTAP